MDFFGEPDVQIVNFFWLFRKCEYLKHLRIGSNYPQRRIYHDHTRPGWSRRHSVSPFQMTVIDLAS